ncbi:modular serine protease-like [Drosophila willistoni]|uniref:modular serine protease-like n=1 Tax=Drosophila willistoni TaxID=7260 RepID=UPI001F0836D0|nr:modular serine protease-like [Drosophila willistoni]
MHPECSYPNFQCANGKCLDPTVICDNKFDCPDGSDEVPNLCENICKDRDLHDICKNRTHWNRLALPRCFEPIGEGVRFTTDTKFHRIQNKTFVYANQAVKFECIEQSKESTISWNVCLTTSEWRTTLPRCKKNNKDNKDPKTNGTLGCPLNYYKNDTMMILSCTTFKTCNYRIQPPIRDQMVKIVCNNGYYLVGQNSNQVKLNCIGKKWIAKEEEPRCTKFCNYTELTGLYAINAKCEECSMGLLPGQLVSFNCAPGFLDVKREPLPQTECLEDGTWSGLTGLRKKQLDLCSYSCMVKTPSGPKLSSDAPDVAPSNAPWIVALYLKEVKYICAGTLIRLDLVLTAAHCLYNKNTTTIKKSDLSIRYLKLHSGYTPNSDTINVKEYRIHP